MKQNTHTHKKKKHNTKAGHSLAGFSQLRTCINLAFPLATPIFSFLKCHKSASRAAFNGLFPAHPKKLSNERPETAMEWPRQRFITVFKDTISCLLTKIAAIPGPVEMDRHINSDRQKLRRKCKSKQNPQVAQLNSSVCMQCFCKVSNICPRLEIKIQRTKKYCQEAIN